MKKSTGHDQEKQGMVRIEQPARSKWFFYAKRSLQFLFAILVLPRRVSLGIAKFLLGRRAFSASSESIARVPGFRGVYLRQAFYRATLDACGSDVYFGWQSVFSMTEARVGNSVYIGRFVSIGYGDIQEGVMLADGVQILSGGNEHGYEEGGEAIRDQPQTYCRVTIGCNAWIGAGAIVMADVGEGAIVGAGAVVTRPVPPRTLAAGVPARIIRKLHD